jgi:PAS domain S-box-containing protein
MIENTFGMNIIPDNDFERLKALATYRIMDTPSEASFDNVARLATQIFKVPISLVSLVDADRVFFKANIGMGKAKETNRGKSLCALAVLDPEVTVFEDALKEPCLIANPNVAGDFGLRFYAGAPLITHDGFLIGTLCIIDKQPRQFTAGEEIILKGLAVAVMDQIELRLSSLEEISKQQAINEELLRQREETHATNEELRLTQLSVNEMMEEIAGINEEMMAANKELHVSHEQLTRANEDLSESESRIRNLIMQAPVAIGTLNGRELVIGTANQMMLDIWGKNKSVIGKPLHLALPELEGQPFLSLLDNVYNSGKAYYGKEAKVALSHSGTLKDSFINFVYHPVKGEDGATKDVMVVATDVTEQVDARKAVDESNQRLELALDSADLGSYDVNLDTGLMECSEQCKKNYGLKAEAAFNFPDLFDAILPEYRDDVTKKVNFSLKTNSIYHTEYQVRWPDGSVHWINAHGKPRFNDEGRANRMVGVTQNITSQKEARLQVEKAEQRFRLISDNISQLAWMADAEGSIFWYNQRWFDFTGTTLEQMYGWGWQKVHHPDHVNRVVEKISRSFKSGEDWEDLFPLRGIDGKYHWFLSRAVPVKNDAGEVLHWFGTNTDVTEQHQLEERKDEFLSIASHELKTPVTSLKASLQLLNRMKDKPMSAIHGKLIEQSYRSMEKMSALIDDLLNVNRLTEGQLRLDKSTFTIAEMLNQCCNHIRIEGKYELVVQGDEELKIYADEHRIDQVVVNFVNNAVKYAPDSKKIYISIEKLDKQIKIAVKDTGPGIPEEKLPFLFDRYYRADHSGKGYGGQIGVESELGKGSTFWFTLPLIQE